MNISVFHNGNAQGDFPVDGDYFRQKIEIPAKEGKMTFTLQLPIRDIQSYWTPQLRTPGIRLLWNIIAESAAQSYYPFASFFNLGQTNRFSIGTTNLVDDTRITAKMNQESCIYEITVDVTLSGVSEDFDLIIDRREVLWTEALADWRTAAGGDMPLPEFPAGAWEPVFCTWYAIHAAMTQDWVEANCKSASELGFKTLIIDDGWCFDEKKRVSPETLTHWYEQIGDWKLSKEKFPDFDAHRQRVQAMGMKYMLWVTPFLIGAKSELCQEIRHALGTTYHEGRYLFDSSHKDACEKVIAKLRHVIEDYKLDGLKVDFLDEIRPSQETPRGMHTLDFIRELSREIRNVNPEALIEFRQSYSTIQMIPYGTQFRAGDVPFDYIDNFQRLCQIRISMGDGVPVHADPAYWHPAETTENAARHMIASLVGVPMISMELTALSETEKNIIRFWLDFYQAHRNALNLGKWNVRYHLNAVAYALCNTPEESILILNDSARLSEALAKCSGRIWICNLSPDALSLDGAICYTPDGRESNPGIIPEAGLGVINK